MAESHTAATQVLIPITNHTPFQPLSENRNSKETKTFLVPVHDSYPLGLLRNQNSRRFTPQFDQFPLDNLFSTRDLTEEEKVVFSKEGKGDEDKLNGLEGDKGKAQSWGVFSSYDRTPHNSVYPYRVDHAHDSKRSRPKEKGLRKLSQRAYEIVLNMRSASYKEVANKLVDELNSQRELEKGVRLLLLSKRTSRTSREGSTMP